MSEILKQYIINREHHQYRKDFKEYENLSADYKELGLCPKERMTRRFELLASLETPVFLPEEKICFLRTVKNIPDCFTEDEWEAGRAEGRKAGRVEIVKKKLERGDSIEKIADDLVESVDSIRQILEEMSK